MSLILETLILATGVFALSSLPLLLPGVRRHSRIFFLMGTGAMFGLCFFELIPDLYEMAGVSSLWVMAAVWAIYSAIHVFYLHRHHHNHDGAAPDHGLFLFLASIYAHNLASGMLLVVSQDLTESVARTVFLALLIHKAYEALSFSSILVEQHRTLRWKLSAIAGYVLILPLGVILTSFFHAGISQSIAVGISSVAVGTLLGCLIFDFLVPSLGSLKANKLQSIWVIGGLLLTQLIMMRLH